jgi:hypothetical protein
MSAPKVTDFMAHLGKELVEKKGVAESTASSYVRTMFMLNNKEPFKTVSFLRNKEEVKKRVAEYAESTQKTVLAAIVSVLSLFQDKTTYKSLYKYYHELMMAAAKVNSAKDTSEKTDKQKENWIDWKDIVDLNKAQRGKMIEFANKKSLSHSEAETLLQTLILSLYTCIQPRRNQDYLDMMVVKKWSEDLPKDKNYLDLTGAQFVFNKYKTAKKYGAQIVKIPNDSDNPLMDVLVAYLKHNPEFKTTKGKTPTHFILSVDGKPMTAGNSITRILNRIFGKKVGSSMIRHIFLSNKYDITEMEKDSLAMGHSIEEQRKYMKRDDDAEV